MGKPIVYQRRGDTIIDTTQFKTKEQQPRASFGDELKAHLGAPTAPFFVPAVVLKYGLNAIKETSNYVLTELRKYTK